MMLLCGVATKNEALVCEAPIVFAPNCRNLAPAESPPLLPGALAPQFLVEGLLQLRYRSPVSRGIHETHGLALFPRVALLVQSKLARVRGQEDLRVQRFEPRQGAGIIAHDGGIP